MTQQQTNSKRILALDILRGITIAGMILVNNPHGDTSTFLCVMPSGTG